MKTVIEMAREAGLFTHKEVQPELERFAELVRADAIADAVEREREACAKLCEELHPGLSSKRVAEAIRARGETSLRSDT